MLLLKIIRIVKDSPKEQKLLLKACERHCNIEYKGNLKALYLWLEKSEHKLQKMIKEKIGDEKLDEEFRGRLLSENDKPDKKFDYASKFDGFTDAQKRERYQKNREAKLTKQIEMIWAREMMKEELTMFEYHTTLMLHLCCWEKALITTYIASDSTGTLSRFENMLANLSPFRKRTRKTSADFYH